MDPLPGPPTARDVPRPGGGSVDG